MNDRVKHFLSTAAITTIVLIIFAFIPVEMYGWDKAIAVFAGVAAAVAKELVWDKMWHKGTPDFYDFVAGLYGAFAAMFAWAIIETIIYIIKCLN